MIQDNYKKDNGLSYDNDKNEINEILIPKYLQNKQKVNFKNKVALVLDGKNARSSRSLINLGFKPESIFVPNNKEETYIQLSMLNLGINVSHESLDEFVRKQPTGTPFNFVYADYCGSFSQEKLNTIETFYKNGLWDNDICLLAITISQRSKEKTRFVGENKAKLINEIIKLGIKHETDTFLVHEKKYRGMITLFFKIDNEIEFSDDDESDYYSDEYYESDDCYSEEETEELDFSYSLGSVTRSGRKIIQTQRYQDPGYTNSNYILDFDSKSGYNNL